MSLAHQLSKEDRSLLETTGPSTISRLFGVLRPKAWRSTTVEPERQPFPGAGDVLVFSMKDVIPLAIHALRAPEHRPAKDIILDRDLWLDPSRGPSASAAHEGDWQHMNLRKVPAALELVCDHGVYLMSNGIPGLVSRNRRECESVFAHGFNPYLEEDWQKWAHRILGRQKVSRTVPIDWVRRAYARRATTLRIMVKDDRLSLAL